MLRHKSNYFHRKNVLLRNFRPLSLCNDSVFQKGSHSLDAEISQLQEWWNLNCESENKHLVSIGDGEMGRQVHILNFQA